jgi:hypothetical protein
MDEGKGVVKPRKKSIAENIPPKPISLDGIIKIA